MKKSGIIIALFFSLLLYSCGKETQNTTQGGGKFVVTAKVSPPLQAGSNSGAYNLFQIAVAGSSNTWLGQSQSNSISELSTDEIAVTKGQNIGVVAMLSNAYDLTCRTITLQGIQNGKIIKTYTLNIGYDGSLTKFCKDGNTTIQKNFIIE